MSLSTINTINIVIDKEIACPAGRSSLSPYKHKVTGSIPMGDVKFVLDGFSENYFSVIMKIKH